RAAQSPDTTHRYALSLHDALPISTIKHKMEMIKLAVRPVDQLRLTFASDSRNGQILHRTCGLIDFILCHPDPDPLDFERFAFRRSEEHTSELQSRENLVCRLLLEK